MSCNVAHRHDEIQHVFMILTLSTFAFHSVRYVRRAYDSAHEPITGYLLVCCTTDLLGHCQFSCSGISGLMSNHQGFRDLLLRGGFKFEINRDCELGIIEVARYNAGQKRLPRSGYSTLIMAEGEGVGGM